MTAAPRTIAGLREQIARLARAQRPHLPTPLQRNLGTRGVLSLDQRHQALHVVSDRPGGRGVVLEAFGADICAEMANTFSAASGPQRRSRRMPPAKTGGARRKLRWRVTSGSGADNQ